MCVHKCLRVTVWWMCVRWGWAADMLEGSGIFSLIAYTTYTEPSAEYVQRVLSMYYVHRAIPPRYIVWMIYKRKALIKVDKTLC